MDALRDAIEDLQGLRNALADLRRLLLERKWDPGQPRVPAGSSDGGQWTDGAPATLATMQDGVNYYRNEDGSLSLTPTANRSGGPPWKVDLIQESKPLGPGHATDHIGVSDDGALMGELDREKMTLPGEFVDLTSYKRQEGSYDSIGSANAYTNDVLNTFPDKVQAVIDGRQSDATFLKRYSSPTGREAYRRDNDPEGVVRIRPAYSVFVKIVRASSRNGFAVITSYPKNQEKDY